MKKILIAGILTFPMLFSAPLFADKLTDQINAGLKAYEDKDYKMAVEELKYATIKLQKLEHEENKKLLPEALKGWTKQKVKNRDNQVAMAMLGGGTTIKSSYKKDKEKIDIEVMANSPMLAMVGMMINNPAMIAGDDSMEAFRYKRIKGVKKVHRKTTEITLLLAGQIMLKITGKNVKDDAVLEQYLDAMDMKKLKASLL